MAALTRSGPRVRVAFERTRLTAPDVLAVMTELGPVRDMAIEESTIESIIQHLYDHGGVEAAAKG